MWMQWESCFYQPADSSPHLIHNGCHLTIMITLANVNEAVPSTKLGRKLLIGHF